MRGQIHQSRRCRQEQRRAAQYQRIGALDAVELIRQYVSTRQRDGDADHQPRADLPQSAPTIMPIPAFGWPPSAVRMPISLVRRATDPAVIPYKPTAARSSATKPNGRVLEANTGRVAGGYTDSVTRIRAPWH